MTTAYSAITSHLRRTFRSGKTRNVEFRKAQLRQLKLMVEENEDQLCDAVYKDIRRCKTETVAYEIIMIKNEVDTCLAEIDHWVKPRKVGRALQNIMDKAYIKQDPLGLVLVIAPWNYPLILQLQPLAGAIAAGNCVIIKPSEISVNTSEVLAQLVPKYLDQDCYKVVTGGVKETTDLLKERFDHIFYTGSTPVGKVIMTAAAKYLTPVTLELGGKSPVIVDDTADVVVAAKRIGWGKWLNSGQTCIAPDYLLCHPSVKDRLIEELKKYIRETYGEDPHQSSEFSRIINERNFDRITAMIGKSGKIAYGGASDRGDKYIQPTILDDVSPNDPIMQEEIFGPVLPIITVNSVQEAVDFITDREKPLALYIFSKEQKTIEKITQETSSGGVTINDCIMHIGYTLPFGGVGASGMGRYHGQYSFDTFSHEKSCLEKGFAGESALWMRYPPYDKNKTFFLQFLATKRSLPNLWPIIGYVAIVLLGFLVGYLCK